MARKNSQFNWWLEVTRGCERAIVWSKRASSAFVRPSILAALLLVLVPVGVMMLQPALHAGTNLIVVNTVSDPFKGPKTCSLRGAITSANTGTDTTGGNCAAGTGNDKIIFGSAIIGGTITLGSALPPIQHTLTIDGTQQNVTIDGGGAYQMLVVNAGASLALNNLTIAHGNNSAGNGGGVDNEGTLDVTNSTFSGNSAGDGGAIYNNGTLAIVNSTFSGSTATGAGGGIYNNSAATVTNVTFSSNNAPSSSGGGIYNNAGTATVTNSILANSTGGNCAGAITNGGYNISDDGSCGFGTSSGAKGQAIGDNVTDLDLALAPGGLANNGGPTKTIALETRSSAIDAIPIADCPFTDQRGVSRPGLVYIKTAHACDVGAYEFVAIVVDTTSDSSTSGDTLCSLREAISNANDPGTDTTGGDCSLGTGSDTIVFSVSGTITLGSTLPAIANSSAGALTIDGTAQNIIIDGASTHRVLYVNSGATLNLNNLTIANGKSTDGGGVNNQGTLTVTNSTFSGNSDDGGGGGIYNNDALTVTNSTFSGNSAGNGGGIDNAPSGTLTVLNSTFSQNSAGSGGGIHNASGTATVTNSILANSTSGNNCSGTITDGGYNISDDASCGFAGTGLNGYAIGDNVSDINLALDPAGLANNGGPTQTIALESGSYAADAAPIASLSCHRPARHFAS